MHTQIHAHTYMHIHTSCIVSSEAGEVDNDKKTVPPPIARKEEATGERRTEEEASATSQTGLMLETDSVCLGFLRTN